MNRELMLSNGKTVVIEEGKVKLTDEQLILEDGKAVISLTVNEIRKLNVFLSENL